MTPTDQTPAANAADAARQVMVLAGELMPLCRSITGNGLRDTLRTVASEIPLVLTEIPTGTQVFDWTVPNEWNIRDAYIKNSAGERLVDFQKCSLHVVNYSVPVRATMTRADLEPHLHSLPNRPGAVPYKTSYYRPTWGFCLSHSEREALGEGPFDVCIDSTLEAGSLTYGDLMLRGDSSEEVLISTHCCHPYMANDNLSGIGMAVQLAKWLQSRSRRYSYRLLFLPGTIGSITWLSRNDSAQIKHGLVLSCVGDPGAFTYKKSRRGNAVIDRAVAHVLAHSGSPFSLAEFSPYGYDERQYNSPGFNLPVGCFMRTPHAQYPEYHTSDDNLSFISEAALASSFSMLCSVIEVLEGDERFLNLRPQGEPQLGKYGLYSGTQDEIMALLWVLNLSDGNASLLDIAERSRTPFHRIRIAADKLTAARLLRKLEAT